MEVKTVPVDIVCSVCKKVIRTELWPHRPGMVYHLDTDRAISHGVCLDGDCMEKWKRGEV